MTVGREAISNEQLWDFIFIFGGMSKDELQINKEDTHHDEKIYQ